jgi:hypothetical protein
MKTIPLFELLFVLVMAGFTAEAQIQPSPFSRGGPDPNAERVDAKIIKVFSASDEHAKFRAYVVKWKDQEIVVIDPRANTPHKEGETISVYVRRQKTPDNEEVLVFTLNQPHIPFRRSETH